MRVTISGKNVTVKGNSLSIDKRIKQFPTCSFTIRVRQGNDTFFQTGESVVVFNDAEQRIFTGVVYEYSEGEITPDGGITFSMTCWSNVYYVQKRLVAQSYEGKTCGFIVRDIIGKYLADEGITGGDISDGKTVGEVLIAYQYANEVLDELADRNLFWWDVDIDRKLMFVEKEKYVAPWTLEVAKTVRGSLKVKKGNSKYRNKQVMVGQKDYTSELTQVFKGDGKNTAFTLGFPASKIVSVEVSTSGGAYVAKSFGLKGLSEGKDFYWADSDAVIAQDSKGVKLLDNEELKVVYVGLIDIVTVEENSSEIYKKGRVEIGSGLVEAVKSDSTRGRDNTTQVAKDLLEMFATEGTVITYSTSIGGLEPGMLQNVNLPNHNILADRFLVTGVTCSDYSGKMVYNITLVKGPVGNDWVNFFAKPQKESNRISRLALGASNVSAVQKRFSFTKTWTQTEAPNLFDEPTLFNDGKLFNDANYFTLGKREGIKYVAWYDANSVELGRTKVIKVESSDRQVYTLAFIDTSVIATISWFGWIGGSSATDAKNTGYTLDKQLVDPALVKTKLDIYQIEKFDKKGW